MVNWFLYFFSHGINKQTAACKALKHFALAYLVAPGNQISMNITSKHLGLLRDPNVAVRRGSAMALGVFPYELLANSWRDVIMQLCTASAIEVSLLWYLLLAIFVQVLALVDQPSITLYWLLIFWKNKILLMFTKMVQNSIYRSKGLYLSIMNMAWNWSCLLCIDTPTYANVCTKTTTRLPSLKNTIILWFNPFKDLSISLLPYGPKNRKRNHLNEMLHLLALLIATIAPIDASPFLPSPICYP